MVNLRKKLLVNKDFQYKFIFQTMMLSLLTSIITIGIGYYFINSLRQLGLDLNLDPNHSYFLFLNSKVNTVVGFLALSSLVNIALIISWGLYYSNKIAGPLFRFTREMNDGLTYEKINHRNGDFFKEVFEAYNNKISKNSKNSKAS